MSIPGTTTQPANALAIWHSSLSVPQQKKLNTDLLTKAMPVYGRDLRKNFRDGLASPATLHADTVDFVLAYSVGLTVKSLEDAADAGKNLLVLSLPQLAV